MSRFPFRSLVFWLIIWSAKSNKSTVESFVVSRPIARSAFSKLPAKSFGLHYSLALGNSNITESKNDIRNHESIQHLIAPVTFSNPIFTHQFEFHLDQTKPYRTTINHRKLPATSPAPSIVAREVSHRKLPATIPAPSIAAKEKSVNNNSRKNFRTEYRCKRKVSHHQLPETIPHRASLQQEALSRNRHQIMSTFTTNPYDQDPSTLKPNDRAKINQTNVGSTSCEYEKELNQGGDIESIIGYCYLQKKNIIQPCIFSRQTIPIQVCEGEFRSRSSIPSQSSASKLIENVSIKVKLKALKIQVHQSQPEFISIATPVSKGDSSAFFVASNCNLNISKQLPSKQTMPINQLPQAKVQSQYQLYCCVDGHLPSSCEGELHEQQTLSAAYSISNDYCCVDSSNLRLIVVSRNYCRVAP